MTATVLQDRVSHIGRNSPAAQRDCPPLSFTIIAPQCSSVYACPFTAATADNAHVGHSATTSQHPGSNEIRSALAPWHPGAERCYHQHAARHDWCRVAPYAILLLHSCINEQPRDVCTDRAGKGQLPSKHPPNRVQHVPASSAERWRRQQVKSQQIQRVNASRVCDAQEASASRAGCIMSPKHAQIMAMLVRLAAEVRSSEFCNIPFLVQRFQTNPAHCFRDQKGCMRFCS